MADVTKLLERVERELAAGRLWRAKEILRGWIAGGCVEPAVLERYGQLLDQTGERFEAGKYLFLSGLRKPEYAPALDVFWSRNAKRSGKDLVRQLPTAIRRQEWAFLPVAVREELTAHRVSPTVAVEWFGKPKPGIRPGTWRVHLGTAAGMLVLFIFVLALVVGIVTIASWLWALFAGYRRAS